MTGGATPTIEILAPTPPPAAEESSPTFDLARSLDGAIIGLRLDQSWRSYFTVVDVWEDLLARDGAAVRRFLAGDRVGPQGEQTRTDLDEWSRLIEVGVVGLGN